MPTAVPTTAPATESAPASGPDGLSDFRIDDAVAIAALLRSLMDRSVVLNLTGSDGSAMQTQLWAVEPAQRRIAFNADLMAPQLQRLVEADEASAVGYLDQVRVQFDVADLMLVHGHRASVLQAALPGQVYRFQRRSAFRVRMLQHAAPTVSFRHPELPDIKLELRLLDLSAGGCALQMPPDMPPVPPGVRINGAHLQLDTKTRLDVGLIVHHVTAIQPQSEQARLGCELLGLEPPAQRALQRYIDQTQKMRRLLSLD